MKAYDYFIKNFAARFGFDWVATSRIIDTLNVSKKYIYEAKKKRHLRVSDFKIGNPYTSYSGKLSNYYQITISGLQYLQQVDSVLAINLKTRLIKHIFEYSNIPIGD